MHVPADHENDPTSPGERIGPYTVVGVLGRGGMGTVYEAEEDAPRRRVALKVLHARLRTPDLEALALREAQALADVHHPGIPSIYALHRTPLGPVVAMELVEGLPLLPAATALPASGRLQLLVRLCEAVDAAHRRGIVHRDLKPANVLVTPAGQPKVLDFGIAWRGDGTGPARAGTPAYMAPEQASGEPATPATDVYALGIVAAEVLSGERPAQIDSPSPAAATWSGDTAVEPRAAPAPTRQAALRRDIEAVLRRARQPDPSARYPDAGALAADLRACLEDRVPAVCARDPRVRFRSAVRRHPYRVAAGAFLGLSAIGLVLGAGPLRAIAADHVLHRHLADLQADPRGPTDPEVAAALAGLLGDPAAPGTPTLAKAWRWRASLTSGDERLEALAAAWVWSGEDDLADREALAHELDDDPAVVRALGPYTDSDLAAREALADWNLGDRALEPWWSWIAPLSFTTPLPDAGEGGALLPGGRRLERHGAEVRLVGTGARTWTFPGNVRGVVADEQHFAAWGDGAWIAWGPLDGEAPVLTAPGEVADAVLKPDGALFGVRYGAAGVYRVAAGGVTAVHGQAEALPVRGLDRADLDGDGQAERIVAATGWRGHDLRVLTEAGEVLTRRRCAPWSAAVIHGLDGPRLWVLGGALPDHAAARGDRDFLAPMRLIHGALVPGPTTRLMHDGERVLGADLDGDGTQEVLVNGDAGFDLVDPTGARIPITLPGLRLIAVANVDADPADELWVEDVDGADFLLGTGDVPLARPGPRPSPQPTPPELRRPPARQAWERVARLVLAHRTELVEGRLPELAATEPDSLAVAKAALALTSPKRSAAFTRLATAIVRHPDTDAETRGELTRRLEKVFDGPGATAITPDVTIDLRRDLPPSARLGPPPSVWYDAISGVLSLDLLGDDGPALVLPVTAPGPSLCVDLTFELEKLDWSAGLEVAFGEGDDAPRTVLWRVGGGPTSQHVLSYSILAGNTVQAPFALGKHTTSVCFVRDPAEVSVRLDDGARATAVGLDPRLPKLPEGPFSLVFRPARQATDHPTRFAGIDLISMRLRGASFSPSPADDPSSRAATGDVAALQLLAKSGPPRIRALAAAALGGPGDAPFSRLSADDRRALLRRDSATWSPLLLARDRDGFATDWLEAWQIPWKYEDPSFAEAIVDPALAAVPTDSPNGATFALARARAMLATGRAAAAATAIASLVDREPEARFLAGKLALRMGDPAGARAHLARWLKEAPSPEQAHDTLLDDPDLAALFPELSPAPRWEP